MFKKTGNNKIKINFKINETSLSALDDVIRIIRRKIKAKKFFLRLWKACSKSGGTTKEAAVSLSVYEYLSLLHLFSFITDETVFYRQAAKMELEKLLQNHSPEEIMILCKSIHIHNFLDELLSQITESKEFCSFCQKNNTIKIS